MLDTSNADPKTKLMNEAIFYRGLYVQRYAGIEFSFTHLITMARHHPAYNHLGDTPFRDKQKRKRLDDLLAADGPIKVYTGELQPLLDQFDGFADDRHFMVHGILATKEENGVLMLACRLYQHRDGGLNAGFFDMTLKQLEALANSLHPTSEKVASLVSRIGRDHLLAR